MAYEYVIPRELTDRLQGLGRRIRTVAVLAGVGQFVLAICGQFVSLMLADWAFDFEPTTRLALLGIFSCVSLALAGWWIGRPWLRKVPDAELAAFAEQRFPQLGERLTSLIELADSSIPQSHRGSPLMREMLEVETVRCLAAWDIEDSVGNQRAMRSLWGGLGATATILASLLIFPTISGLLFARLINPLGNFDSAGRLTFEVANGDQVIARGSDVVVVAKVAWRSGSDEPIPEPISLQIKSSSGEDDSRELRFDPDRAAFVTTIPKAFESFDFVIAANGNRSKKFRVAVVDAPAVIAAKLEISPPGYIGEPRREIDGVMGEIPVFERSQLRFQLTFNKPVKSAEIEWMSPQVVPGSVHDRSPQLADPNDKKRLSPAFNELVSVEKLDRTALEVSADGLSAKVTLPAEIQSHFAFRLEDEHGLTNEEPHRQLLVLLDQPPLLELTGSLHDEARPTDAYPFNVSVADDFGFGAIELHLASATGLRRVLVLAPENLRVSSFDHLFRIDLADLGVKVGDVLTLQVRAVDERPMPSANEIWSPELTLAIRENAAAPGTSEALKRQTELRDELAAIRKELADEAKQAEALDVAADRDIAGQQLFSQPTELIALAEREKRSSDRIQELAERFAGHPLFANLHAETERLAEQEVAPQAEQLKLAEMFETAAIAGQLQDNSATMQRAEQQVAAMEGKFADLAKLEIDLLEVSRFAHRANELADDAERLEAKRDELSSSGNQLEGDREQDRQADRAELAREEGQLANEQRNLLNELNELLEKRPEIVQAARDHQLDRLAELANQASQLAITQDSVTGAFRAEAGRIAESAQSAIDKQREITKQTEQLAATIDAQQARNSVSPLDPAIAQKTLEALENGNLATAERLAKQSADDIGRAIADIQKNQPLPSDPREAAKVLAARQRNLSEDIGRAAADRTPNPSSVRPVKPDADHDARTPNDENPSSLRDLAARQLALQMAVAQLNLNRKSRDQQQSAIKMATDALRQLVAARTEDAETNETHTHTHKHTQERTHEALVRAAELSHIAAETFGRLAATAKPVEVAKSVDQANTSDLTSEQMADQLKVLAQEQRDLEFEIRTFAKQRPATMSANRQRQLTQEAATLEQKLKELSQQLGTAPISLSEPSMSASQASAAAAQGKQAMHQASGNSDAGNLSIAATDGDDASKQIRKAAFEVSSVRWPRSADENPIPPNPADQLASAAQRLSKTQQRLEQEQRLVASSQQDRQFTPGKSTNHNSPNDKQHSAAALTTRDSQEKSPKSLRAETDHRPAAPRSQTAISQPSSVTESLQIFATDLSQIASQITSDSTKSPNPGQSKTNRQLSFAKDDCGSNGALSPSLNTFHKPKKQTQRNWGELPSRIRTEILQPNRRNDRRDYVKLSNFYLGELAASQEQAHALSQE